MDAAWQTYAGFAWEVFLGACAVQALRPTPCVIADSPIIYQNMPDVVENNVHLT